MKYLLYIAFLTGVVLIGFQNSAANPDGKDKKPTTTDRDPELNGDGKDTVLKVDDVEVRDTLVFDDFDEDDEDLIPEIDPTVVSIGTSIPSNVTKDQTAKNNNQLDVISSGLDLAFVSADLVSKMTLFPNPVSPGNGNTINIHHNLSREVSVMLMDESGRQIQSWNTSDLDFSFTSPSAGVYHVILTSGEEKLTSRLLVR